MSLTTNLLRGKRVIYPLLNGHSFRFMNNRSTENNTFHPRGILAEPEEEYEAFKTFDKDLGHLIPDPKLPDRKYEASSAEWHFVERLTSNVSTVIPTPPPKDLYPSGFYLPTAKFGDNRYFISRTSTYMLPVYLERSFKNQIMTSKIRKVDGDLFALRDDLDAFLFEKYQMQFISQVAELFGKVSYRGDFIEDFKEFCRLKGF
uniref:Large ribosomal subunit protein mL49 n=1 Tax=Lepeophtheirus salmonis TaxID=72036 RepID=D3PIW0_LEPSM|nr:Probable 39S ribosomal protein L49, mitochondrial [Lepeophtheirus salmonis]